jgi:hypothetical protein
MAALVVMAPVAGATSKPVRGCTVVADPRGDADAGPLTAAGYDPRDLDLLGFELHGDGRHLLVRSRSAHLSQPLAPPGYRLSYQFFWSTHSVEAGNRSWKLTAEFDGASSVFTLGATAAGDPAAPGGGGKTYAQVGGPLPGTVDYRTAEVTVDIPYQLVTQYAPGHDGLTLYDPAAASYWGIGNPSVSQGNTELIGSSGYNRIADGAVAEAPFRLTRSSRCTS